MRGRAWDRIQEDRSAPPTWHPLRGSVIKVKIEKLLQAFTPDGTSSEERRRIALLVFLSCIGIVFLAIFSGIAIGQSNLPLAIMDCVTALILALNLVDAKRRQQYPTNIIVGIIFVSALYVYLYVSGGVAGTAFVWYYTYPLIACYLMGSRKGGWASGCMILPVLCLALFKPSHSFFISYSNSFVARFAAAYIVVMIFSYLFEKTREHHREELRNINQNLEKMVAHRTQEIALVNAQLLEDIKKRELTESALMAKEQKYRSIVVNISDLICVHDLEGRILETNLHYKPEIGYTREELIDRHLADLIDPAYQAEVLTYLEHINTNGQAAGFVHLVTKKGHKLVLEYNNLLVHGSNGDFEVHGFARDITDRWKAEKALEASEKHYRTLFEKAGDAIFIIDASDENMGRIIDANQAAADMHGYTVAEIKQLTIQDLDAPREADLLPQRMKEMLDGEWAHMEIQHVHRDGSQFPVEVSAGLIELDNVRRILAIDRNISDRRDLEEQIRQSQKMESIGNLAGGIAHDFNNILFPIMGITEMLLEDFQPDSREYKKLEEILKAGQRASGLVNQILSFSRQSEKKEVPVSLQLVLKEVLKLGRSTIPANIEIYNDLQWDCSPVLADPTQMHQIAMNLITNAYHAVEASNGTIAVTLHEVELTPESLYGRNLKPGWYAVLNISDTGGGIDPANVDRIFDPYFTTKEKGKGTGLGLAVVYGIVTELGGEIKVDSNPGQGTTFSVILPLIESHSQDKSGKQPRHSHSGTESILVVDDESIIANLISDILARRGYRVTTLTSSLGALETFRRQPHGFDLMVTDMTMPKMTGDHLTGEILAIRPDLPIIICTGYSERIDSQKAVDIGAKGLLLKPVSKADLTRMIRNVLDNEKPSKQKLAALLSN